MKTMLTFLAFISLSAFAVNTGEKAPDFTLKGTTSKGKEVSLSDYKGKIVVLEWVNHGCPFVRKHYDSGNMQALQKKYTSSNVIWLTINSSAPGKQGHVDDEGAISERKKYNSAATDVLLDPTGKVGKMYEAKVTPHMYVIDKEGTLVYQGAIDDKADTDQASIPSAKNYVAGALTSIMNGKKVTASTTRAYGCAVKY